MPTWLGGVTLGVAIRMVALGHYRWNELAFLAVALGFVGVVAFAVVVGYEKIIGLKNSLV